MYDVDKLNMFFYNYDDDMKPILSEEQLFESWIKEQNKEELKLVDEADRYLKGVMKGLENKNTSIEITKEARARLLTESKEYYQEWVDNLNTDLNTNYKNINQVLDEEKNLGRVLGENYIPNLVNIYNEETGYDFYSQPESVLRAYIKARFDKEYLPDIKVRHTLIRLALEEILSHEKAGGQILRTEEKDLRNIFNLKQRLLKIFKTRQSNVRKEYWESLGKPESEDYSYNKLLEAEINIFINPVNYWQMRMPIVDDYLKKELLPFMNSKVDKWREQNPDLNYVDDKKSTYSQVLTPSLNITKTILYLQGKAGVGIFALQGTAHAISGYTFMPIENNYSGKVFNMNGDDSKSFVQEVKSSLPFDKSLYNNDISHNTSKDGKIITETNSQLLSSQVDIGKSPYPAVMGIILENLGFLSYLMRRGVPMEIGLQLVQHPVVKKFTKYRASKESIYSKALKEDSGRNDIIKDYITDVLKHSDPELAQMIQNRMVYTVLDSTGQAKSLLSTSRIDERVNIKINKGKEFYELVDATTEDRMNILMGFFQVLDQSVEYSKLIKHVKFDTQTFKDKTEFDSWKNNKTQLAEAGFFSDNTITDIEDNSLIAPFKKVKDKYGMFDNLYYENMTDKLVPRLIGMFKVYKTEDKQNMSKKLSADLITYLVQNKMNQFLDENNLLRQKDGKAFEMTDVQATINQFVEDINKYEQVKPNYFLDKMNIMLGFLNGTSAIFTRDRVRNTYEIDDMLNILQEIKEENPDIFTKIVLLPFLSTGLATGRFNYQDVLPQELRYKLIYKALIDSIGNITKDIEDDFLTKFIINNFNSIKTQNYHAKANISKVTRVRLYEGGQSQHYIRIPSNIKTPFKDNIIDLTDLEKSRVLLDYLSSIPRITSLPQAKTELRTGRMKLISGGQTGIDRLGLEIGKELGLDTGGTATPGYYTEIGNDLTLKDFGVQEISKELQKGKSGKEFYLPRTEQNVLNSDGTVYFATDADSAGKIATERFAKQHDKAFILNPTVEQLREFIKGKSIINIAGNRGSKVSEEFKNKVANILRETFKEVGQKQLTAREYTSENITELKSNEVFVFGSNAEGVHGKGAALLAKQKFGAIQGQSEGLQGQSYAVITKKNWRVEKSSTLQEIGKGLQNMLLFAKANPSKQFLVTKLGSSLAGYTISEIKGLFQQLKNFIPDNVILPKEYEVRDSSNKQLTENKLNPQHEKFRDLTSALLEFNKVPNIILEPVIGMTQVIKKNDDGTTTLLAVYDKNNQLITSDFLMKDDRRMTLNEIMEDLYTKICKI